MVLQKQLLASGLLGIIFLLTISIIIENRRKVNIMDQKKKLTDEILKLREELKEKNEMINNLGRSVSFFQLFVIPLIASAIATLIIKQFSLTTNQSVGFFIVIFILSLIFVTMINKNKLAKRKDELIKERMAIQKELVAKGKELSQIEN